MPVAGTGALSADARAPGLVLGEDVGIGVDVVFGAHVVVHAGVRIGEAVSFGAHVVVHDGTVIGDGCVIEDHAVLGKRPRLARGSSAKGEVGSARDRRARDGVLPARWCSRARASRTRRSSATSPMCASVRGSVRGSVIGRGSVVDNDVVVGARVKVQTNVYLTAFTVIEDDVFVGPGSDHHERRHDGASRRRDATARRDAAARVSRGRRRGADPGRGDRRGGVRGRRRGRHPRRAAARGRDGRARSRGARSAATRICSSAGASPGGPCGVWPRRVATRQVAGYRDGGGGASREISHRSRLRRR